MRKALRVTFSVVTILLLASTALQIYFAAMGVFSVPEDELFGIHGSNGRMVLPVLVLLTVLFAALARSGKKSIWLSVLLIPMLAFQTVIFILVGAMFPGVGPDAATIPLAATMTVSLHALNGLAIIWVSSILVRRAWLLAYRDEIPRGRRAAARTADAAREPGASQIPAAPAQEPARTS
ncbi:DUF6220 domain-containing protein [Microbacter sp. GSS18]|nr:DUF6220 domain-containing protein [Microbacter sp. GSS18]